MKSFGLNRRFNHTSSDPMILEIDTTLSTGTTYSLGFWSGYTGMTVQPNFVIDWGDGTSEVVTDHNGRTKTYASAGTYQIKIYGTVGGIGWGANAIVTDTNRKKLKRVIQWGNIKGLTGVAGLCSQSSVTSLPSDAPKGVRDWFGFLYNCTTYNGSEICNWNTSSFVDVRRFFQGATSFNQNIGSWNTSSVTTMVNMFNGATAFNQNIGAWDVSNCTNMFACFQGATAFNNGGNSSINNWNTASVIDFANMFYNATSFNQPIGNWTVSPTGANGTASMFYQATAFNQNIGTWTGTSNILLMQNMFYGATAFNNGGSSSINNWNTSSVTNMSGMFQRAKAFNQPIGSWNTANVTNMSGMFRCELATGNGVFNQDIGSWNVSKVTDFSNMFGGLAGAVSAFNNGGSSSINNWVINTNAAQTVNMSSMFTWATSFNQPIGSWNTSRVTNMASMFNTAVLFNQPLNSWTTSNVSNMSFMFQNAAAFNQPLNSWNTSNVTNMRGMFLRSNNGNCPFNQDIGSWNVSKVTDFSFMFMGQSSPLQTSPFNNGGSDSIKNWVINTTAGVNVNMSSMFMHNSAFNQPIGSWNTSRVSNLSSMFSFGVFNQNIGTWNTSNCTSFDTMFGNNAVYNNGGINSIAWDTSLVSSFAYMFNNATSFNQPIPGFKFNSATNLGSMLNSCGMSNENYSRTLIGWANTISSTGLGKSKSLGAAGPKYNSTNYGGSPYNTGSGARTYLTTAVGSGGAGWTISDGGAGA